MDRTLFLGKEVEEWFVAFEKELRQMLEMDKRLMCGTSYVAQGHYHAIKEILGDSP